MYIRNLDILGTYVYSTDIFSIASDLHVAMIIVAGEALFSIESRLPRPAPRHHLVEPGGDSS